MKKLIAFGAILLLISIAFAAKPRLVTDYAGAGAKDYQLVQTALDSNGASYATVISAIIDSVSTIAKRPLHVPLEFTAAAQGTLYHYIMTVPVGMTATIRAATISARFPPEGADGSDTVFLFMRFFDADSAILDSFATTQRLSDSAEVTTLPGVLVADSTEVVDIDRVTTFAAGDVLYIATYSDSAYGGQPQALGITFDIDMDE